MNSNSKKDLTSKEKRASYMSQLRGSIDSEYRRTERENNARAMRKKRLENPHYREQERRQNRAHMAQLRRENSEYRQREHIKNRHRMALKRHLIYQKSLKKKNHDENNPEESNSIYQTLENNLQSSHISFIPYQTNIIHQEQRNEYEFLKQIDDYCRQQDTASSSDSNSRSTASY